MKTVQEHFIFAEHNFPYKSSEERRLNAEIVLSETLGIPRVELYLKKLSLEAEAEAELVEKFDRIAAGEPVQHVLGYTYFRSLKLQVNPNVLIPRPETELIIDKVIDLVSHHKADEQLTVIDIGTGSGAIALSVGSEIKNVNVVAVDISKDALKVAETNCKANAVTNVAFYKNNLCEGFSGDFADIIIANLPYVSFEEYENLDPVVKDYDPKLALYGGLDGLDLIKKLIKQAETVLKKTGWILLEIGYKQGQATAKLLRESEIFENIEIIQDYNELDRFVIAQKTE